jgi:hypothetical protein
MRIRFRAIVIGCPGDAAGSAGTAGANLSRRRLAAQDAGGGRHQPATAERRDRLFHRERDQEPARPQAQPLSDLRPRTVRRCHRSDQGSRRPDRRVIIHNGVLVAEWGEPQRVDMTHSVIGANLRFPRLSSSAKADDPVTTGLE